MKSEVRVSSPSLKITITIGFFVMVVVIVLATLYRYEFSLILLSVAGSITLIGIAITTSMVLKIIIQFKTRRVELHRQRQLLRIETYQADKKRLEAYVLSFPKTQRIVTLPDSPIRVIEAMPESKQTLLPAMTTQDTVDLLTVLTQEQRVLIKGASDAGKTTLLQWLVSRKVSYSKVLVIDPHASSDKWAGCKVVGLGSNHKEIATALDKLIDLMVERYQDIAQGLVNEGEHSKITIVIDEWMSIAYQCGNAKQVMIRLLTESRKAAFSVYVGSHSDRVASLGLDGKGDLRDGFCMVKLTIVNDHRQATINYGNGEIPALLPGPFVVNAPQLKEPDDFINLEVEPNSQEAAILHLAEQGESFNEIARQIFGSSGGHQVNKIKVTINKFQTV